MSLEFWRSYVPDHHVEDSRSRTTTAHNSGLPSQAVYLSCWFEACKRKSHGLLLGLWYVSLVRAAWRSKMRVSYLPRHRSVD
jgi:hypothetical protein